MTHTLTIDRTQLDPHRSEHRYDVDCSCGWHNYYIGHGVWRACFLAVQHGCDTHGPEGFRFDRSLPHTAD